MATDLRVNGKRVRVETDRGAKLLEILRDQLGLTGAKYGCGEGRCGSCTVLLDGEAVRACTTPIAAAEGKELTTVEGLATDGELHPVQQAFLDEEALQCGYCTSRNGDGGSGAVARKPAAGSCPDRAGDERTRLPLRNLSSDRQGDRARIWPVERRHRSDWARVRERSASMSDQELAGLPFPEQLELEPQLQRGVEVDRRDFLRLFGGGIAMLIVAPSTSAQQSNRRRRRPSAPTDIASWLHIDEAGGVTVYTGKVEVGQNIRTSLAQAVADELRCQVDTIEMVMGDTERVPYDMGTFGSLSTPRMAPQLRKAAAAARESLLELAAERLAASRAPPSSSQMDECGTRAAGARSASVS